MRRGLVGGVTGLAVVTAFAAHALAAPTGPTKRAFTEAITGANISMTASKFEAVYKVVSSLDGTGASIQDGSVKGTGFPLNGKSTTTTYFANGVGIAKSTFKLGALDANGIAKITGNGKCAGGTRVHKNEKCTFIITGTYNSKTTIAKVKVKGTDTR
jgi:hypothetical protein